MHLKFLLSFIFASLVFIECGDASTQKDNNANKVQEKVKNSKEYIGSTVIYTADGKTKINVNALNDDNAKAHAIRKEKKNKRIINEANAGFKTEGQDMLQ